MFITTLWIRSGSSQRLENLQRRQKITQFTVQTKRAEFKETDRENEVRQRGLWGIQKLIFHDTLDFNVNAINANTKGKDMNEPKKCSTIDFSSSISTFSIFTLPRSENWNAFNDVVAQGE